MKRLGGEIARVTGAWGSKDDASRIARRAAEVQSMFKAALEHLYKEKAGFVLEHVNAVYIKKEQHGERSFKALYVYMDDGNFRSDVHSQQHFIMLFLKDRYGEDIELFKTYPSRMGMKNRHPYASFSEDAAALASAKPSVPLSEGEVEELERLAAVIEDACLRKRFSAAAKADKEWKKGEEFSEKP